MSIKSSLVPPSHTVQHDPHPEVGFKHHFKRILVVTSLYFRIQGTQCPSEDEMEKVNRSFDLAWRCEALLFPAAVAGLVWRKIDLTNLFTQYCRDESCLTTLATLIQQALPVWLWYQGIQDDICGVFASFRMT